MKKSAFMSILALAALLAAGCVSSTTGPPPPDPDEDDAAEYNYQLGARYYGNKSYELARDRLERAIELDPKLAKAHMTLGMVYEALDHTEAAEQFYRAALERKATYGEALLQLCLLKYQQEDYLHARAFLQRFMSANVTTAGVLYLASEIERKLGNERGRDEFVNQLLRDFPESPEARRALGSG
ncbi:MAG: tetratricopeptide repeat protein [Woeseiaceae bacterium]